MPDPAGQKRWWEDRNERATQIARAVDLAKTAGVEIDDEVRIVVNDDYMRPDCDAQYEPLFSSDEDYTWERMLARDEQVWVRIHSRVFDSDVDLVGVIAHEMYEINSCEPCSTTSPAASSQAKN